MTSFINNEIMEDIKLVFDLPCMDNHKSFYGKAQVIETTAGRYLKSYQTIVLFWSYGGTLVKLWDGYSATTMRHINSFMQFVGLAQYSGKNWWQSLPYQEEVNLTNATV